MYILIQLGEGNQTHFQFYRPFKYLHIWKLNQRSLKSVFNQLGFYVKKINPVAVKSKLWEVRGWKLNICFSLGVTF